MKPVALQEMLRAAMRDNSRASEKEIHDLCLAQALSNAALTLALFEYWFRNSYRDFTVEIMGAHSIAVVPRPVAQGHVTPEMRAREVEAVKERMKACLMDYILSDGTMLRNATFGQCANEGGWLIDISKQGAANEIVGKKLKEIDLRNLLKRNAPRAA